MQPDAQAWRGNPSAAESSMRVLTVPHVATTIINGALPSGFEESHQPRFWVLEFIIKVLSLLVNAICAWPITSLHLNVSCMHDWCLAVHTVNCVRDAVAVAG